MTDHAQFASPEIEQLLRSNGLATLEDAFRLGEAVASQHRRRATRHANKCVVRLELNGPTGALPVYIKRQWSRERWLPRPTDLRHRINLLCSPIHEWRGLVMLKKAGFHVSRPLALFYRGWGLVRGAIITQAVPPNVSMADLLLSGDLGAMESPRLHSLVTAAARVAARLHQSQLSWRSMKAKHFYPEELPIGKWRIWLIDCEGAYRNATQRDCEREWNVFLRYFATHTPSLGRQLTLAYRSEFQRGSPACELKPAA